MRLDNVSSRHEIPFTLGTNFREGVTCVFLKHSVRRVEID